MPKSPRNILAATSVALATVILLLIAVIRAGIVDAAYAPVVGCQACFVWPSIAHDLALLALVLVWLALMLSLSARWLRVLMAVPLILFLVALIADIAVLKLLAQRLLVNDLIKFGHEIGAIERIRNAGVSNIGAIHRGFSAYAKSKFRNAPYWEIPIELRRRMPELPLICDNSHICGNREDLLEVAQQALDLNYDGLMTEVHPTPDAAWSDAKQQITPFTYAELVASLVVRRETTDNKEFLENIENLRHKIDEIDLELLNLLSRRMRVAEDIGRYKLRNNIAILQAVRWNEILEKGFEQGRQRGLNDDFIEKFLSAIHNESIVHQQTVMHPVSTTHP